MTFDLICLVIFIFAAIALLRLVPHSASRAWAIGLLLFAAVSNFGAVIGSVVAYYRPESLYLEVEKHQLELNRDENGEVYGVTVKQPPKEIRSFPRYRPWALAIGNFAVVALALAFLRRGTTRPADSTPTSAT